MTTVKEKLTAMGVRQAINYLERDPETNLPKLMDFVDKYAGSTFVGQRAAFRTAIEEKNNWYTLLTSMWTDIDAGVRTTMFNNFIVNACIDGWAKQEKFRAKYQCNIPWAILMDPTSACNLHCTGCWAADYGSRLNLDLETLDRIVCEGKEMGTYMYIYSGGEPLVRKADLLTLCERHSDCMFLSFTNATLIDDAFAREMLRVKNFIPAISVEGFRADTDDRRGKGTFDKVRQAMEILKAHRLPFGVSCCYTSKNVDTIGSEVYFDQLVQWGAKFAWFFTYMPVGVDAVPELMATAEQRAFMYRQIRAFRKTKPLFTIDFWNDGDYVGGCIAGGRNYLHINAAGDIEPCAFIHYADSNIHDKTLLEAYRSPLFMAYHDGQPFNENFYRPCPLLDNPECLNRMVKETGASSTDMQHPEPVDDLCAKCRDTAQRWAPVADSLWAAGHHCPGNR